MGNYPREEGDRVLKIPTAPVSIGLSLGLAIGLLVASVFVLPSEQAVSREPDKTLKLYFGHTGETGEFTFKRNGRYDRAGIRKINHFLRDWRKKEDANMDPHLLDLVWAIYKESGSREAIHVISAYRSPATNNMLRAKSNGVAKNSQHMLGKAMDWYLPDVPLAKLRGIAMKMQGGGVGYYPRSGSPFVHTDTGNVRAWPRMSRQQLLALFPKGNTLHLPADGKPLPGYELAVARRKAAGSETVLAYLDTDTTEAAETDRTGTSSTMGWLKRVFPGDGQEDTDLAEAAPPTPPPATTSDPQFLLASTEEGSDPRVPRARPGSSETPVVAELAPAIIETADAEAMTTLSIPPMPRSRPDASVLVASLGPEPAHEPLTVNSEDAIASLTARVDDLPAPTSDHDPIELAFAAAAEQPSPSEADRAILTTFSTLDQATVHEADAVLMAAVIRLASDTSASPPSQNAAIVAMATDTAVMAEPTGHVAAEVAETGAGIVIGPDEGTVYASDENALVGLIETPKGTEQAESRLAMPNPQSELYRAPEGAAEVADLRGIAGPPVDRFVRSASASGGEEPARLPSGEQPGFFSKLFASLIE
jgi:uncharacterized protein YcbK (DUF882 family)